MIDINNSKKFALGQIKQEAFFKGLLIFCASLLIVLVVGILTTLIIYSMPSIKSTSFAFIWGKVWDPVSNIYGGLPFLVGTLLTSFIALIISIPFSISIAVYLGEFKSEGIVSSFFKSIIDLIASIPSVIYGFWGLMVLVPMMREWEMSIGVSPYGVGILTSSFILAIMIIPYSASLGREMIRMVPSSLKEAAYALGATRFEVLKNVILPYSKSGILAGLLLSLGRALGETMAVTIVIGNSNFLPKGIFDPSNTLASVIANEFAEADHALYVSALIELALFLFVLTVLINILGNYIIKKTMHEK